MTSRLRNFCFTINNYDDDVITAVKGLPHKYLVFGYEVGDSNTPHLQGYCELDKMYRFNAIKKLIPTAHIESRKGTAQEAADYCKKDGKFEESGSISNPGRRTDIEHFHSLVRSSKTELEVADGAPGPYYRYYRGVARVRYLAAMQNNKFEPVEVTVIWGIAGKGKTRRAYEIDPNLYNYEHSEPWFDGYTGQETILMDDFYGGIKYSRLLRLLDGYKFNLPIKGGHTWKAWKRVIITSNTPPAQWYHVGLTDALNRRLTQVIEIPMEVANIEVEV